MAHITVELRNVPHEEPVAALDPPESDVGALLPGFEDRRYPLLRLVDPYGDTFFSSYQMLGLIPELQQLRDERDDAVLSAVISLAERCKGTRSYLVFIGD